MQIKNRANNFNTIPSSKALPGGCSCCCCCCCVHGISIGVGISAAIAKSKAHIALKILLAIIIITGLAFVGVYLDLLIMGGIFQLGKITGINNGDIGTIIYIVSAVLLGISAYKITNKLINKPDKTNNQNIEIKQNYHKERFKIHAIIIGFLLFFNIIISKLFSIFSIVSYNDLFDYLYFFISILGYVLAYFIFLKLDNNIISNKQKIIFFLIFIGLYYFISGLFNYLVIYLYGGYEIIIIYGISAISYILPAFLFEYIYFLYFKNYANKN